MILQGVMVCNCFFFRLVDVQIITSIKYKSDSLKYFVTVTVCATVPKNAG